MIRSRTCDRSSRRARAAARVGGAPGTFRQVRRRPCREVRGIGRPQASQGRMSMEQERFVKAQHISMAARGRSAHPCANRAIRARRARQSSRSPLAGSRRAPPAVCGSKCRTASLTACHGRRPPRAERVVRAWTARMRHLDGGEDTGRYRQGRSAAMERRQLRPLCFQWRQLRQSRLTLEWRG
jgi:hypothetical protein